MENKEDILESISSVTKNLEAGLELNNKSSVSQSSNPQVAIQSSDELPEIAKWSNILG